jgi:putative nucleotidyltransferase with HDIG domain
MPVSIVLPTALIVMLISISMEPRLGMMMALLLPMGVFISGAMSLNSYIIAVASGASGALSLHKARRRADMLKAGAIIAVVNIIAVVSILLIGNCPLKLYPFILFWAAVNGVASGMLVLGILPIIENALHLATTFKLIELLDTSAPILRKLESSAPGTYSHSMMVANLAETACNEIGAKALLARVGAYYHDIGKIDHPEYFVENQKLFNKHNELNPRLSATIIRSHVKLGIEKARAIGLPTEVISFIAEHHGNSLIKWFYNAALEKEGQANVEDFCYPGNPPRSRESAVVMLADVTEAATRTLEKPTVARLEKFIDDLFSDKYENGQLAESALTFHDMETIKSSFVRVLVGFYHSRIEYPKISKTAD